MQKIFLFFLSLQSLFFYSCSSLRPIEKTSAITHLKFLNEYDIPYNKMFNNTAIGGFSGIDNGLKNNRYYIISDDRSEKNPARFYTVQILINKNKIDSVVFINSIFLRDKLGNFYPNSQTDPFHTPDPESIRFNPLNNNLVWSSEGERIETSQQIILEDPAITQINAEGNFIDTFQLPGLFHMKETKNGPRQNGVFEGLSYTNNFKNLFVSLEEPLYDDGAPASLNDSTGVIRIIKFNEKTKKPIAQFAYPVDPVAYPPFPLNAFKINGVSEILSVSDDQLLMVERSYSTGRLACTIKIFLADLSAAENIENVTSLKNIPVDKMISKKLLLNMNDLGIYIDNIEGMTFGPTLPNGNKTLIFVSDNNFNPFEKTQFLLFEIQ